MFLTMPRERKKAPNLTINLARGLYQRLHEEAERDEKTKTRIIEDALRDYFRHQDQQNKK